MDIKQLLIKKESIMGKIEKLENLKKNNEVSDIVYNKIKNEYSEELNKIEENIKNNSENIINEITELDREKSDLNKIIEELNIELEEITVKMKLEDILEDEYNTKSEEIKNKLENYNERLTNINTKLNELREFLPKDQRIDTPETPEVDVSGEIEKTATEELNIGEPMHDKEIPDTVSPEETEDLDDILQPSSLENIKIGEDSGTGGITEEVDDKLEELFEGNNNTSEEIQGLKCPKCGHINKPDLFNCEKCGADLL